MKENLKIYSDEELTLRVENDEYLWNRFQNSHKLVFISELRELFEFNESQLNDLMESILKGV